MSERRRLVVISGPTASGKSDLAMKMAEKRDIAIINADSLQIFAGLPILSSQPSAADHKSAKHFLYSHFKANEYSSVVSWLNLVKIAVAEARAVEKLPIIVGGSGMYISKLIEGISEVPEIDEAIRQDARQLYDKIGHDEFKQKLIDLSEDKILDKQRLIRAYEVLQQTGNPISWWQDQPLKNIFSDESFLHVNLEPERQKLYENCNSRFEKMLKMGAIEEVQNLLKSDSNDNCQITKTLGFYEISNFLEQKITKEKVIEISSQKTRNYAKRQLTWFRHQLKDKSVFSDSQEALIFLNNEI